MSVEKNNASYDVTRQVKGKVDITLYHVSKDKWDQIAARLHQASCSHNDIIQDWSHPIVIHVASPQEEEKICQILDQEKLHFISPIERKTREQQERLKALIPQLLVTGLQEELTKVNENNIPKQVARDLLGTNIDILYLDQENNTILDTQNRNPEAVKPLSETVIRNECQRGPIGKLAMLAWSQVVRNPNSILYNDLRAAFTNTTDIPLIMTPHKEKEFFEKIVITQLPNTKTGHPALQLVVENHWGLQTKDAEPALLARGVTSYQVTLTLQEDKVLASNFLLNSDISLLDTPQDPWLASEMRKAFLALPKSP